jgi:CRP-like cAMP-binding protein
MVILEMPKTCNLRDCFLCQHCIPAWRELIGINKTTKLIRKGKPIFNEGDTVEGIFFIYQGCAKVHKQWAHPRELVVRFAGPGDIIGHRGLGEGKNYPLSATALDDTLVCFISDDFLETSLRANPTLSYRLMNFYMQELQQAERRMRDLALMEVKGRLAGALLDIRQKFGTNREGYNALPVSRQDIASYAGTTYETLFKLFHELVKVRLISTSGKFIKIKNEARLRELYAAGK